MRKLGRLIGRYPLLEEEIKIEYGEPFDHSITFDSDVIEKRSMVVTYLMKNEITQWNPITLTRLAKKTGIDSRRLDYILNFGVSPLNAGVVEVVDGALIYLTDFKKAKDYLQMTGRMKSLL